MLSAGNDIVSLSGIDITRTKQPNFYSKILTPSETALHSEPGISTIPFEVFVWLLWSIKESAFKFLQRIQPDVVFTPVKFEVKEIRIPEAFSITNFDRTELTGTGCDNISVITSTLTFKDKTFYSNSLIYSELISTTVNDDKDFSRVCWGFKQINKVDDETRSNEVRIAAINHLQQVLGDDRIIINMNKHQIPVAIQNQAKAFPVSLSHHENWVGYSFPFSLV